MLSARPDGVALFDDLMTRGRKLTGFASDDAHFHSNDSFGGWVQVKAETLEPEALLAALKAGKLGGAGLDVLGSEKDPSLERITRELLALPNVVCTQHTGGSSREGLARANMLAAQCVLAALDNGLMPSGCVMADGRSP
jgi:hypothetical protein